MGKIRVSTLGSEEEAEQKRRAEARRQTKKSKKEKVENLGLKGGERVAVVEGSEIKPEFKRLVEEVEQGEGALEGTKAKKAKKIKIRVRGKRYQEATKLVEKNKFYKIPEAVALAKKTSTTKFDGTVELHVNLNAEVLGKKDFRGSVKLPHGTGKLIKVAIADDATIGKIESGKIDFDILVAPPQMMPKLARVAKILGPKGLMPNPKNGTVSPDPEKRAKELTAGEVNFKTEPDQPILHLVVGKVSFEDKKLEDNVKAYLAAIGTSKIVKATLASTMGPGIKLAL